MFVNQERGLTQSKASRLDSETITQLLGSINIGNSRVKALGLLVGQEASECVRPLSSFKKFGSIISTMYRVYKVNEH